MTQYSRFFSATCNECGEREILALDEAKPGEKRLGWVGEPPLFLCVDCQEVLKMRQDAAAARAAKEYS